MSDNIIKEISCVYLSDKITGKILTLKPLTMVQLWKFLINEPLAPKAGMLVHGRIITASEYSHDGDCTYIFEAVY